MSSNTNKVTLIFGASGISGWALMRECLSFPSTETFSRVIGLSHRPLSKEAAHLPNDPRLELHSGLDLTNRDQTKEKLGSVPGIDDVTHVYFVAYTGHGGSPKDVVNVNATIVDNALIALNELCPKMEFFGYGIFGFGWPPAPWKEDLPRMPEPYASDIFYYAQCDVVARHAANKSWGWSEIRPSYLPGFVPHHNAMNVAQSLGLFLSYYRSMKGAGAECVFPGTPDSWTALRTESAQDLVAHIHIHVSLHTDKTSGRSFNVGDGDPVSWELTWPVLCEYFGLKGVGPLAQKEGEIYGIEWLMAQKESWPDWTQEQGLRKNALEDMQWDILQMILTLPVRIDYDLGASREIGFREILKPGEGYMVAFDRLREAQLLP
ncbi:hypothetical protein CEP51_016379 [Fusarium floridanum]|uniref:PRISE-like Rossmann-fold domain-containing protein n=1 Tax=Fusarium floridanum TaxID=1325733 RepID=A0A428NR68_9HYPO|nr:hypothetical protein CEP51_016379 [Fusarium floridanum]